MSISPEAKTAMYKDKAIVLFDGDCSFCNGTVARIIPHDTQDHLRFATLNSEVGRKLRKQFQLEGVDSIIVVENGLSFIKSTAIIKLLSCLSVYWPLSILLRIIPGQVRDIGYDIFAASRYNIWNRKSLVCQIPASEFRHKFLDI